MQAQPEWRRADSLRGFEHALLKRNLAVFDELRQSVKEVEFLADPSADVLRVERRALIERSVKLQPAFEPIRLGRLRTWSSARTASRQGLHESGYPCRPSQIRMRQNPQFHRKFFDGTAHGDKSVVSVHHKT